MTESKPRGKLKQARLGNTQRKILLTLLSSQVQQQQRRQPFYGLSYQELQAQLYGQAHMHRGQWLQTVWAQLLMGKGDVGGANAALLQGIALVIPLLMEQLQQYQVENSHMPFNSRIVTEGVYQIIGRVKETAHLIASQPNSSDPLTTHTLLVPLARDIAELIPLTRDFTAKDVPIFLTPEQVAAADKAVATQQASMSRALKSLEEHGLIEQQAFKVFDFSSTEKRYFPTQLGKQRVGAEDQKAQSKSDDLTIQR